MVARATKVPLGSTKSTVPFWPNPLGSAGAMSADRVTRPPRLTTAGLIAPMVSAEATTVRLPEALALEKFLSPE